MSLSETETSYLAYCQEVVSKLHRHLTTVKHFPHPDQGAVLRALFAENKKVIMGQCGRSYGKALALDTPMLTTSGWKSLKDIHVGDYVFSIDGTPARVIGESPIFRNRECFEVKFSDGTTIVADAEHLWLTSTKDVRKSKKRNRGRMPRRSPIKQEKIVSTKEIERTLFCNKKGEANHFINNAAPLQFPTRLLEVHPYVLGVWLGDGNQRDARVYTIDSEILDRIRALGYEPSKVPTDPIGWTIRGLRKGLQHLNVLKNKHVPKEYLFASKRQRLELLRGLLDTDGSASKGGFVEFCNTNENLVEAVRFLVVSLGMKCYTYAKIPISNGKICAKAYRVCFSPREQVFFLERKAARIRDGLNGHRGSHHRAVSSVTPTPSVPVKCLAIDHPSHLYLAGEALIPTHNTEQVLYMAWRYALTHPNSETYIICPEIKQAKKIYWLPKRLQSYGPREYVLEEWESKLQVLFKNGSHIILDGCENYESLRGIKPDFVIYDEFQHHTKFFDEEVMQPNLSRGDVALVVMGTPPKRDCYYVEFRNNVLDKISQGHKDYLYVELPSSCNPILDKSWLAEKKADLFRKGKQNVWFREYEGKLVFDTESAIFPMFDKSRMVFSPQWIAERIGRDRKKLQYFAIFDPGTATCFAVLFAAINPYTSDVFLLDEIYETRRENTSAMRIWLRACKIKERFNDDQNAWINIYDEAAAWFENEIRREAHDQDFLLIPTRKQRRNTVDGEEGRPGESIIMASMDAGKFHVSAECEKFVWEIEQYVRDEQGNYPLTNDHLVDCLAGDVLVDTLDGPVPISELEGKQGMVWSIDGLDYFDLCKKTHVDEPVFEAEFSNGSKVKATEKHQFLTEDGWKELRTLTLSDRIVLSTNKTLGGQRARKDHKPNPSSFQPQTLLSLWQVFQSSKERFARLLSSSSGCLDLSQWSDTGRYVRPSHEPRSIRQSNRKPYAHESRGSYDASLDKRSRSFRGCTKGVLRAVGQVSRRFSQVEKNKRGEGLAQGSRQGGWRSVESLGADNCIVRILRWAISSLQKKAFSFLRTELPNERISNEEMGKVAPKTPSYTRLVAIRPAGRADTFCMRLRRSHAFSVEGGIIVHNCAFYLYLDSNYSLKGERNMEEDEDNERRSRPETFSQLVDREMSKRDYAREQGDDIYDTEDISDIWN